MSSPRALIVPSLALLFLAACHSDRGVAGPDGDPTNPFDISASISDGANGGSLAVWYLPPLVPNPQGNPDFEQEKFKDDLDVVTKIYLCDPDCPAAPNGGAVAVGPATVDEDKYAFQWKVPGDADGNTYRAFTIANGVPVGFIDLLVNRGRPPAFDGAVVRPNQMANIHVMIEEVPVLVGLECADNVNQCRGVIASGPTEDAVFDLEDIDDDGDNDLTLQIPAGTQFTDPDTGEPIPNVTFSLETCAAGEDLDADLVLLGDCFEILTLVDGVPTPVQLSDFATISICDLNQPSGLPVPDPDLVSIIHFDNGVFAEALEHADPVGCDLGVALAPEPGNFFGRLARVVSDRLADWFGPRTALATSVMLDIGGGGKVDLFQSKFRAALMTKIVPAPGVPVDGNGDPILQQANKGSAVVPAPAVQVLDAADNPVPGAFVRFQVLGPAGNASVDDPDNPGSGNGFVRIMSDANGIADATWVLETGSDDNPHQLAAFAAGMNAGTGTAVLQPTSSNIFFGGTTFCASNECVAASQASDWILGESILFQANASDNMWNELDPSGIRNQAFVDGLVSLAPGDGTNGFLPAAVASGTAAWFGDPVPGHPTTGNYMGLSAGGGMNSGGPSLGSQGGTLSVPLTVPALGGGEAAFLTFQTWWEIESVDPHAFDLMIVSVRDAGGAVTQLGVVNPPQSADPNGQAFEPFTSAGYNQPPAWVTESHNISAYAGQDIEVLFEFRTVDGQFNGFRGWVVDDIQLPVFSAPSSIAGVSASVAAGSGGLRPVPTESVRSGGN